MYNRFLWSQFSLHLPPPLSSWGLWLVDGEAAGQTAGESQARRWEGSCSYRSARTAGPPAGSPAMGRLNSGNPVRSTRGNGGVQDKVRSPRPSRPGQCRARGCRVPESLPSALPAGTTLHQGCGGDAQLLRGVFSLRAGSTELRVLWKKWGECVCTLGASGIRNQGY